MDPPPFSPHGRFSVLTEALLGLLYTHTHTDTYKHSEHKHCMTVTLRETCAYPQCPTWVWGHQCVCVSFFAVCDCACRHPAAVCMFYPAVYLLKVGASSGALVTSQILKRNCTTKISGSRFFHHF